MSKKYLNPASKDLVDALARITATKPNGKISGADFVSAVNALEKIFAQPVRKK